MPCIGKNVVVVLLLLLVVSLSRVTSTNTAALDVALCEEVHGFANEYNDHFKITVKDDPAENKGAVILVARAFPVNVGVNNQAWLSYNATYTTAAGSKTIIASDVNGIIKLSSVSPNSQVEVYVNRLRQDGPVPFRFFSYNSNYPSCFISVAPSNAFVAFIPRTVREGSTDAALIYFETTLPKNMNAFIVREAGNGGNTGVFVLSADRKRWEPHLAGQVIAVGAGKTVYFSYEPSTSSTDPYVFLYLTVEYTRGEGGDNKGTETSSAPDNGGPVPESHKPSTSKGVLTFLGYGAILFVVYMVAGSYYNYSRNGMREFPEMVPHIVFFSSCVAGCLSFGNGLRARRRYGGYSNVDGGTEMDNPYNV